MEEIETVAPRNPSFKYVLNVPVKSETLFFLSFSLVLGENFTKEYETLMLGIGYSTENFK